MTDQDDAEDEYTQLCTREARGAPQVVDCWDCGEVRMINADCIVQKCPRCKDSEYEYDVPAPLDEAWAAKAEDFKQQRASNEKD